MADGTSQTKRVRDESDSPAAKRLREDLLVLLDDSDSVTGRDSDIHDLDSVMRSFEQELSGKGGGGASSAVVDLTSDSGESLPELGYLLEASDDELGLPSATVEEAGGAKKEEEEDLAAELVRVEAESSGLGELLGFEEGIPSYGESFGFGIGEQTENHGVYDSNGNDYVALGGIFDYSDVNFGPSDYSDLSWRSETLPAL